MTPKKKLLCRAITLAPLLALLPLGANALTMKEVERRLQAYESRIQQLEQQLAEKNQQAAAAKTTESSKVTALENQVKTLRTEIDTDKEKFKVNGFMTAGVATHDQDGLTYSGVDGSKHDTQALTKVGIQMAYQVNDKTSAQIQLIGKGEEDFDTDVEWAFLSYDINSDLTLRAGRLRLPTFMLSEYLDVGYAYPWVRPPEEMYGLMPFDSHEGLDLLYSFNTGEVLNRMQFVMGRHSDTSGDNITEDLKVDDMFGSRLTSTLGNWTLGLGYFRGKINTNLTDSISGLNDALDGNIETGNGLLNALLASSINSDPLLSETNNNGNFAGIGFTYDDGDWLLMGEHGRVRVDNLYADAEGNYLTLAKRFDNFQPYISYGRNYTTDDQNRSDSITNINTILNQPQAGLGGATVCQAASAVCTGYTPVYGALLLQTLGQRSMTYGVRYDIMTGVDVKFEYQHIYDIEGAGKFGGYTDLANPIGNADLFNITIDAVF